MKNFYIFFLVFISTACIAGCAEFNPLEAPAEVLKHPLGTDPLRIGMTKNEIIEKWGEPGQVSPLSSGDEWQTPREEWTYVGRYTKIPIDRSYIFKTKYLIFDGNNLVSISNEPLLEKNEGSETPDEEK